MKLTDKCDENLCAEEEDDEREIERYWTHAQGRDKATHKTQGLIGDHVDDLSERENNSAWTPGWAEHTDIIQNQSRKKRDEEKIESKNYPIAEINHRKFLLALIKEARVSSGSFIFRAHHHIWR